MEDKDELETLVEISELLESMLLRLPDMNYDFSSLETEAERESDVGY